MLIFAEIKPTTISQTEYIFAFLESIAQYQSYYPKNHKHEENTHYSFGKRSLFEFPLLQTPCGTSPHIILKISLGYNFR